MLGTCVSSEAVGARPRRRNWSGCLVMVGFESCGIQEPHTCGLLGRAGFTLSGFTDHDHYHAVAFDLPAPFDERVRLMVEIARAVLGGGHA